MVPPVHDDDTDYSDLDEVPANEVNHSRQSTHKTRERLSERTPLLSSSPPPPAYSDVTRGNPQYVPQTRSNHVDTNQLPDDEGAPNQQPQSLGDMLQDPEDGKKDHIRRRMAPNIQLLTFLALLLAASVTIGAIIGSRHKSSSHDVGDGDSDTIPSDDVFPHPSQCNYDYISNRDTFGFPTARSFSFIELTAASSHLDGDIRVMGQAGDIRGTIRILPGEKDQKDDIVTGLRTAKSLEAHDGLFNVDYTAEALRVHTPWFNSRACMEIEVMIWIRPGTRLEHFEVATEHLNIKIEPDIFPPPEEVATSDRLYISNTSDFISVKGNLAAAYWESGRETRIDLTSGSVSGRFALRDLLSVKTRSGSININVEPKPASKVAPRPAEFTASALSGSIKTIFPISQYEGDIPDRLYQTKIDSGSGSISGNLIHGLVTDIHTGSGSVNLNVLPFSANNTGSWFRTDTQGGMTRVNLLPPFKDPESTISRLRSVHKSRTGSVNVVYPQQWEGRIEAVTMTGSLKLHGKDVRELKRWTGPVGAHVVAQKGSGSSGMDIGSSSGSVDATVGDLY